MRMPSFLKSTILAAAATVLGAGAALAGPSVGGINLPSNLYLDTTLSYETLVDPSVGANTLRGVFFVNTIVDSSTATTTYTVGQGNRWLTGYFDSFQFDAANSDATHLAFTGGTLKYYVQTAGSNPFRNNLGSVDLNIANASNGTLWLDVAPVADANGDTLIITLTGGGATSFLDSHAFALGDVIGGLAAPFLDSNAVGGHDIIFTGQANRTVLNSCGPDFGVCGSNNLRALVKVPEPLTLSLFGAGLAGAAALRRRKAKKA